MNQLSIYRYVDVFTQY